MAKRFHDIYAGIDARRSQEARDSRMISEDHGAIANLPQDVKMHPWPSERSYMEDHLDDTISGIDHQQMVDAHQRTKGTNPRKA